MINIEQLSSLDFKDNGMKKLPVWYNLFESSPLTTEVASYIFRVHRLTIYFYFTPKGSYIEVFCRDVPHRDSIYAHTYVAIHNYDDLASVVNEFLGIARETERIEDEENESFAKYYETAEARKIEERELFNVIRRISFRIGNRIKNAIFRLFTLYLTAIITTLT